MLHAKPLLVALHRFPTLTGADPWRCSSTAPTFQLAGASGTRRALACCSSSPARPGARPDAPGAAMSRLPKNSSRICFCALPRLRASPHALLPCLDKLQAQVLSVGLPDYAAPHARAATCVHRASTVDVYLGIHFDRRNNHSKQKYMHCLSLACRAGTSSTASAEGRTPAPARSPHSSQQARPAHAWSRSALPYCPCACRGGSPSCFASNASAHETLLAHAGQAFVSCPNLHH